MSDLRKETHYITGSGWRLRCCEGVATLSEPGMEGKQLHEVMLPILELREVAEALVLAAEEADR